MLGQWLFFCNNILTIRAILLVYDAINLFSYNYFWKVVCEDLIFLFYFTVDLILERVPNLSFFKWRIKDIIRVNGYAKLWTQLVETKKYIWLIIYEFLEKTISSTRGVDERLCTMNSTGLAVLLMACTASSWLAFCRSTPPTWETK